ncbi:uncharacterized protein PHALS_15078 [Plasmopara halstedii]|uniref:Uncharacterized protein n=1 Tax=Plasmopara halstedii TaxID=4781 RepID=A0A0P1AZD9_PLAHL|nr:uncharacterized protein PHALS_15078 [Plasmopara halstedii]CEG47832.1 hypothetical protein PHALS_15078 [Plasmopara halstedii]|eukprot:XP_024584201.1 hypothetical protein PHALS_15078 [Plasmopara halstedii]
MLRSKFVVALSATPSQKVLNILQLSSYQTVMYSISCHFFLSFSYAAILLGNTSITEFIPFFFKLRLAQVSRRSSQDFIENYCNHI